MKCLHGISVNIENYIIGKIIKKPGIAQILKPKNYILATSQKIPAWFTMKAYILEKFDSVLYKKRIPFIYNIAKEDIDYLQNGDIVLLKKDGSISLLYEILSPHNALFVTNRCNLMCLTCPQPPDATHALNFEENSELIKMMDPEKTTSLALTGGEPTILNENFIKLIKMCQYFLPKTSIIVLTNGRRFVDFEFTKKVVEASNNNMFIAVSLYSDNDIIHDKLTAVKGSFYETVKGLHNLALFKQRVEIRVVLTKMNIERLPNIAEFIYHNFPFVTHVALMGLEVTGNAKKNANLLWIDPFEYKKELFLACKYLYRYNLHFSIYNHPLCVVPASLRKFCRQSISSWKKIYLDTCERCSVKSNCGGLFLTSDSYYSKFISPL